ncbi:MAG: UDP-3-O-(3-hydroxymyristoyl)glucosamine N-acyltransferase [Bacteroidetes bacterium]|nr:UDP-3-O-(3-hydroxymyristoyl)glucosamine N-acyltransferase [Bacteroidota bacterium]
MKRIFLEDIASLLGKRSVIVGNKNFSFLKPSAISDADQDSISWLNPTRKDKKELLLKTKAAVIICSEKKSFLKNFTHVPAFISVPNPKLVFIRIVKLFFQPAMKFSIHPSAVIHPQAKISKNVFIGSHCTIGKVTIKEYSVIAPGAVLFDHVHIGRNVIIGANSVLGSVGFGISRNDSGAYERFPHIGGVTIEDNVEIGTNSCIDRGTLGNTIIHKGCKIDNLVHIAHNVVVGENSVIIANTMIGGSTIIGKNSWIAPSSSLRDAIIIGANVTIGTGANVTKNVPDNQTWTGNPARELTEFVMIQSKLKNL